MNVKLEGHFPLLEAIDRRAFSNVLDTNTTVHLTGGGPALKCIGKDAFTDHTWGTFFFGYTIPLHFET